ncbi:hypothetical protein [Niabella drilacis]|uniref:Uncharacterized protein n=1 Tax=Niabella drilacis (strain DSM 25811 / CCM 8410 / CCUG 62505 / LMG 26954 / E90) TaxID=1285928 RepID=A0A1G6LXS0_NIADE|nr:hypothetical protein [Niabella drilacis]SDC48063.1 hypothetical protein SAMN04487894_102493 [Niabella drilacis]
MTARDKYKAEETPQSFSLQPHYHLLKSLFWFFIAILGIAGGMYFFYQQLGEGGQVLGYSIIIYLFLHGLYDFIFRVNVRYVFDKASNAVYRINTPFPKKQLMTLDELVIFTSAEQGCWHYAMGARKRQFIKSYTLSEDFGPGKKSMRLLGAYEAEVLDPILRLSASSAVRGRYTPAG